MIYLLSITCLAGSLLAFDECKAILFVAGGVLMLLAIYEESKK